MDAFPLCPINRQCSRSAGVACDSRGYHASGTEIVRPSTRSTVSSVSSHPDLLCLRSAQVNCRRIHPTPRDNWVRLASTIPVSRRISAREKSSPSSCKCARDSTQNFARLLLRSACTCRGSTPSLAQKEESVRPTPAGTRSSACASNMPRPKVSSKIRARLANLGFSGAPLRCQSDDF